MALKSGKWLAFSVLLYVFLLHASTLYLFTRGFLLTRLSLPNVTSCSACTLPPTHTRAILLIIDALRFDFLSSNPSLTPSPYYHHVLTLPSHLTAADPTRSFIFNTFSDPPTTTLQRIKGITTGSLPTFIEQGWNFAGSQISEDSLVLQMNQAGRKWLRKVAFMGDDTWTSVYPTSFVPNMSFPYDSFNVEDLHSVDEGVIRHIFPLLEKNATSRWDFLIGHFLGVDHVGHRLGPAHPAMAAKLRQMNEVLTRVVESLDDETLLVVLGDHGMDRKGDHGGDGVHETSAATWIYSKSRPLFSEDFIPPWQLAPNTTFPGAPVPHRLIQQIDIVPTLSLLLGLPIPFNNLGTVIPELFSREGAQLEQALRLNAEQVKGYFDAYRASSSGGELDGVWNELGRSWASTLSASDEQRAHTLHAFTRLVLASCRSLWAQFNVVLMYFGLFALALGSVAVWALYTGLGRDVDYWEANGWMIVLKTAVACLVGAILGAVSWVAVPKAANAVRLVEAILIGTAVTSSISVIISMRPKLSLPQNFLAILIPLIHALTFLSNSFTFWEDRILPFLLITSLAPFVLCSLLYTRIEGRLRYRILLFSALFGACVRLASISTVCREEQHPYCHVTFYSSSSLPSPPLLVLLISLPASFILPSVVRRILAISASDKGPAPPMIEWGLRVVMLEGNIYWILEWLESNHITGQQWAQVIRPLRSGIALTAIVHTLVGGGILWWPSSLCLEVKKSIGPSGKEQMQLIGFANSYGSSYLLFVLIIFSLLFVATQLTGQVALVLSVVALLALLEVVDSARDMRSASSAVSQSRVIGANSAGSVSNLSFSEIVPVALLALHVFYATGHQSTIASIQWKSAFLLTPTLTYPISAILVIINTFGSQLLFAAAVPLLAAWNIAPISPTGAKVSTDDKTKTTTGTGVQSSNSYVLISSLRAALGMSLYFSILLVSSAASSAWLRRHLMVWKVFAPRFIFAGLSLLVVDLGVIIGVTMGIGRVLRKVDTSFKSWF